MKKFPTEFKVGLFVLGTLIVVAAMSFQVNNDPGLSGRVRYYEVELNNASGLVKNSVVKTAGIPVGIIKDMKLEKGKAHLTLALKADLDLGKDASAEIKANGILGDKYIEIHPGDVASSGQIQDHGNIDNVIDRGSFDTILAQVGKVAADVAVITENLKKATSGDGDENSPLGRTIHNIEDLTADLNDIVGGKKEKIEAAIDNLHNITATVNEFVNDESDDGFKSNWKKMAKSLGRVDSILRNVDEITAKVNGGKGTIGKLINDDQTVEELNHAITSVNTLFDEANKIELDLDYHSEYMGGSGGTFFKSFIGLTIQPGPDRYYLLQLVDDPRGYFDSTTQTTTTGGNTTAPVTTNNVYHERLTFSAEFAKNFYDLTLRGGVIQNTGGFGVDYSLFGKKLRLSTEIFGFSRPEGADLRAFARYKFYSIFYAVAGGDDILNKGNNPADGTSASGFVGAGLDFTNDDLKLLLSKAPL